MSDQTGTTATAASVHQNGLLAERRQWIRHVPGETRGQLSWDEGGRRVTCEAVVLNINEEGAALLAGQSPAVSQTVWLSLGSGALARKPLEARSIAISEESSGGRLIRVRFPSRVSLEGIFGPQQHERRLWQRYPAREKSARLTWIHGNQEKAVPCELLNISGGGAAVISTVEPPSEKPIWFSLQNQPLEIDPVESLVQGTSLDPSGSKIVRLRFLDPCPMALFELAVYGPR
jgi:hypothetical protein